eukprot:7999654-Lingulodinium_polyedra.AAC.1
MASLGLGDDFELWAPSRAAPDGWRPLDRPRSETLRVLKAAWAERQWGAVAARRQDMAHVADGVDRYACTRLLGEGALQPDAAGALRAVMAGGV